MVRAARVAALSLGLACTGLLAGCGFQPLYGSAGFGALPGLAIEASDDRVGYLIEDALRDHLGGGQSAYRAELETAVGEVPLGLSAAGRARRFATILQVNYILTGPNGFEHIGEVSEPIFYDAPSDPYALITARAAAEERAAEAVAEELAQEFAIVLRRASLGREP